MAEVTVSQFAEALKVPVDRLLAQLDEAGIKVQGADDIISDEAKMELLTHLRRAHRRQEEVAAPRKITLKREAQQEIKVDLDAGPGAHGQRGSACQEDLPEPDRARGRAAAPAGRAFSAAGGLKSIEPADYIFTPLTDRAAGLPNVDRLTWTLNRPLSMREIGRLLKKYALRAGLDPSRITVHTLRHTAAMLRRSAGDDLEQISACLGHASLSITQVYLHRLEGQVDNSWLKVAALLGLSEPKQVR